MWPLLQIPILLLVTGEKLPWSVKLSDCSVYTIHSSPTSDPSLIYILDPASVSAMVAVTTHYSPPPASDHITSLGLCLHTDMEAAVVRGSKQQVRGARVG